MRRFEAIPDERSKDVPWPFRLKPVNAMRAKDECFSAVSQEELLVSILYPYNANHTVQNNTVQ